MSKNLLDKKYEYKWYNINPSVKGINITLEQYTYFLKQELIAKNLKEFLVENGFSIKECDDNLVIKKKVKEDLSEVSTN